MGVWLRLTPNRWPYPPTLSRALSCLALLTDLNEVMLWCVDAISSLPTQDIYREGSGNRGKLRDASFLLLFLLWPKLPDQNYPSISFRSSVLLSLVLTAR